VILHCEVIIQPHVLDNQVLLQQMYRYNKSFWDTVVLFLESDLPSFDTVLHNSACIVSFYTFMADLLQCVSCIFSGMLKSRDWSRPRDVSRSILMVLVSVLVSVSKVLVSVSMFLVLVSRSSEIRRASLQEMQALSN